MQQSVIRQETLIKVEALAEASERRWIPMIKIKACHRCRGDRELVQDQYGSYVHCLQCGWTLDELSGKVPVPVGQEASKAA